MCSSDLGGYVAGHDGDGADIQFRRVQRQHQGHGVVGAGIGIEDYFFGGGRGERQSHYDECGENRGDKRFGVDSKSGARGNQN